MCLLTLVDEFARSRTAIASPYDLNAFAQCGFSDETFICHCPSKAAKDRLEEYIEQSKIRQNRLDKAFLTGRSSGEYFSRRF